MSGGPGGAFNGTLTVMIGGEENVVIRAKPLIDSYAANIVHFGPIGAIHFFYPSFHVFMYLCFCVSMFLCFYVSLYLCNYVFLCFCVFIYFCLYVLITFLSTFFVLICGFLHLCILNIIFIDKYCLQVSQSRILFCSFFTHWAMQ